MTTASRSDKPLHILFIEDSAEDAELEERELRRGGLQFTSERVWTRSALAAALGRTTPDLIVSDYSMPDLDGLTALQFVRSTLPTTPFIFVSGTLGEERAVEILKNGASDYVIKDRLSSLVSKVQRAIRDAEDRRYQERLELQLRQTQKMEAIGRLTAGITHDFNNLLTVITGYAQLLHDELAGQRALQEHAAEVLKAGTRAANLTRQLLAFTRQRPATLGPVDVGHVVRDMDPMLRSLVRPPVTLETRTPATPSIITGDAIHIEQIIMNLVVNSRDAMAAGGRATVEVESVDIEAGRLASKRSGPHVRLTVADTGHGMDTETVSRMFEPFFTTKPAGEGTGLGLSTVYGLVNQAGGAIEVDSAPGKGTRIDVFLPCLHAQAPVAPAQPDDSARPGAAVVLLVEVDPALRTLLMKWLTGQGYVVLAAHDGEEALSIAAGAAQIDAVVSALALPRLGGEEVAAQIARRFPTVRVLFTSGEAAPLGGTSAWLPRPFLASQLGEKLREILGRGERR